MMLMKFAVYSAHFGVLRTLMMIAGSPTNIITQTYPCTMPQLLRGRIRNNEYPCKPQIYSINVGWALQYTDI